MPGIVSIYTSIFVRCDWPPKLRISSVIYLRLKPRNSASFEFPENLVDLVSSLIFLTLGHFHNSKTHKNLFNIPRNEPPSILQMAKFTSKALQKKIWKNSSFCETRHIWYQMKTLSSRNVSSTCFIPWGVSFPSYSQSKTAIKYRVHRAVLHFQEFFFFQGALHDNGLKGFYAMWEKKDLKLIRNTKLDWVWRTPSWILMTN